MKYIINIVLILVLSFSIFKIVSKEMNYQKDEVVYKLIRELAQECDAISKETTLKELNSDYQAWLQVDNTSIDYPVVQTTDNEFYLKHDFNKANSISGAIYLDYRNKLSDENLIIYGHNMRNQTMFEPLEQYKRESFFDQNNKITITLEDETRVYEVFSVYVTAANNDSLIPRFSSEDAYTDYLNKIINKSIFSSNIKVSSEDKILTLYTCSYETTSSRTVIHAKQVKEEVTPN